MRELKTSIRIKASPDHVWDVLTDFDKYPEWNPFIKEINGKLKVRKRLKVKMQPPGDKIYTLRPKVVSHQSEKRFSWMGHLLIVGLFDGHHIFELEEQDNGSTLFIHREEFSGLLVPLFWNKIHTEIKDGFEKMNKSLKGLVEMKAG